MDKLLLLALVTVALSSVSVTAVVAYLKFRKVSAHSFKFPREGDRFLLHDEYVQVEFSNLEFVAVGEKIYTLEQWYNLIMEGECIRV